MNKDYVIGFFKPTGDKLIFIVIVIFIFAYLYGWLYLSGCLGCQKGYMDFLLQGYTIILNVLPYMVTLFPFDFGPLLLLSSVAFLVNWYVIACILKYIYNRYKTDHVKLIVILMLLFILITVLASLIAGVKYSDYTEEPRVYYIEVPFGGAWCNDEGVFITVSNMGRSDIKENDFNTAMIGNDHDIEITEIKIRSASVFNSSDCGDPVNGCRGEVEYRFDTRDRAVQGTVFCR